MYALVQRWWLTIAVIACAPVAAFANDWGMGDSNSKIPVSSIFSPVSTPAHEINVIAFFTIAITAAIFVIVGGLLTYAIVRFRRRPGDDDREPPQVYGSNPIEFAWTTVPVLIVLVLVLTTVRTIYTVQARTRPPGAISVRVIAHQWWWEFRYPDLGIVTANELHVPLSDRESPTPTFLDLESADVAHSFWVPRLAGKTDVIPNRKNDDVDRSARRRHLPRPVRRVLRHPARIDAAAGDRRAARRFRSMGRGAEAAAGGRRVGRARPANFRIDRLRQLPHHSRYRGQRAHHRCVIATLDCRRASDPTSRI